MRSSKLVDFFIALGENLALTKRFHEDPEGAMRDAGLGDEELDLVRRRDEEGIRRAMGPEHAEVKLHMPSEGHGGAQAGAPKG